MARSAKGNPEYEVMGVTRYWRFSREKMEQPIARGALFSRAPAQYRGRRVLDPFCGCGTAILSAQKLKRRWIGIDVTHLAISLIKTRLQDSHGNSTIL